MAEPSLAEIVARPDTKHSTAPAYRVLYDGQCEICQACVAWLKTLDHENKTVPLPISAEVLPAVDSRLKLDECLRQLHVVTPKGEVLLGWDAVASLARLFPSTWIIGTLGKWFPFRNIGRLLYGFVATNRYSLSKCRGGACRVAKPQAVRRQARLGAFWSCYTLGFFIRLPLVLWAGIRTAMQRLSIFVRTYHRRLDLLNGKLTILFLNGLLPNAVPLLGRETAKELSEQRQALEQDKKLSLLKQDAKFNREREALQKKMQLMDKQLQKKTANELGDGAEIDLFEALRECFPSDTITRIPKGQAGADILHEVLHKGESCGKIIIDSKNRQSWQNVFVTKLRQDQVEAGAEHAILATTVFPAGKKEMCVESDVIVISPARVIHVTQVLRRAMVSMHVMGLSLKERSSKMTRLYKLAHRKRTPASFRKPESSLRTFWNWMFKRKKPTTTSGRNAGRLQRASITC